MVDPCVGTSSLPKIKTQKTKTLICGVVKSAHSLQVPGSYCMGQRVCVCVVFLRVSFCFKWMLKCKRM